MAKRFSLSLLLWTAGLAQRCEITINMKCNQDFYYEFKPIRNKLKSFRKDQIMIVCFQNLAKTYNLNVVEIFKNKLPLPWHTMLIFKWGVVYGANKIDGKSFTQNDFIDIYNTIKELLTNARLFKSNDPVNIWRLIRANFAGQYPYQLNNGFYGLAVTEIILKDIGIDYDVDNVLNTLIGINLEEFINFQCIITSMYVSNNAYFKYSLDFFKNFSNKHDLNKLDQFLHFISLDFYGVETFLTDHHISLDNPEFEFNLLSPLSKKPLYRFGGNFVAYNKTLLNSFCEYGLYDILKSNDSAKFSSAFGLGFETYLTYSLNTLNLNYFREKNIRKEFNVGSSVDFLFKEENNVLLIEAKSSEMSELTPLNPEKKYLEQTFQNSLIKGYKQIFFTAFELKKQNPISFRNANFWGLIVTYKDFMFGAPEAIWLEFMKDKMHETLPNEIFSNLPLDPLKIFVVSIYEFDTLCLYTKKKGIALFDSLAIPFENNNKRETKNFSFALHFPINEIKLKDFEQTKNKLDTIMGRIEKYLK